MTRLLVCGSRSWTDRERVFATLDQLHEKMGIRVLMEGCAHGADELAGGHPPDLRHADKFGHPFAGGWAWHRRINWLHFPADWYPNGHYNRAAGAIRNSRMLADGEPEYVVAFDKGSKGTADMVAKARNWGLTVLVVSEGVAS